ncbi:MAG: hypothetical protein Q8910_00395 [Bacteroidota bacterium]|nr:hypothetical protein [Bacteroidota bacterium]
MAAITVTPISKAAVELTYVAATATTGDTIDNGNNDTLVSVKNGNAAEISVGIAATTTCDEGFEHDVTIAIPASEERLIPLTKWVTSSAGLATLICTPAASVTLAAFRKV